MAVTPHARSLADLADRVEVAAAYSPSEARRQAFAARFPFPVSADLAAIAADRSIAAVLLLTPPNTHLSLVRDLAAAGKHILLEKPLAGSLADAKAVVQACATAGVALGVVFQHRFRPGARLLAERIRAGALGTLANAAVGIRWWRPQSYYDEPGRGTLARDGGGVLITQAIHTLDLFLTLTPPVSEVIAFAGTSALHRMETEDSVAAALAFEGGALGALDATTAAFPGFPETISLVRNACRGPSRTAIPGRAVRNARRSGRDRRRCGSDGVRPRRASGAADRVSRCAGRAPRARERWPLRAARPLPDRRAARIGAPARAGCLGPLTQRGAR
jgi:predicted dehydrogenase